MLRLSCALILVALALLLCPWMRRNGMRNAHDRYRAARSDEGINFSFDITSSPGKGNDSKDDGKGWLRDRARRPSTPHEQELSRAVTAMLKDADEVRERVRLRRQAAEQHSPATATSDEARQDGKVDGTLLVGSNNADGGSHQSESAMSPTKANVALAEDFDFDWRGATGVDDVAEKDGGSEFTARSEASGNEAAGGDTTRDGGGVAAAQSDDEGEMC